MKRISIAIDGLEHKTAIPVASKTGPLLASSVISPFSPGSRDIPESIEAQFANIFRHSELILQAAGGSWDNLTKMEFWLAEASHRPLLEPFWVERFPDALSRPARHTHVGGVARMSASLLAYIPET